MNAQEAAPVLACVAQGSMGLDLGFKVQGAGFRLLHECPGGHARACMRGTDCVSVGVRACVIRVWVCVRV